MLCAEGEKGRVIFGQFWEGKGEGDIGERYSISGIFWEGMAMAFEKRSSEKVREVKPMAFQED